MKKVHNSDLTLSGLVRWCQRWKKRFIRTYNADILIVVGTSLVVYPAAGLVDAVSMIHSVFIIDPVKPEYYSHRKI